MMTFEKRARVASRAVREVWAVVRSHDGDELAGDKFAAAVDAVAKMMGEEGV